MEATIEEEVLRENVLEGRMVCSLCNVTAVNLPTWESHKQGKKHLKMVKRAVEEKMRERSAQSEMSASEGIVAEKTSSEKMSAEKDAEKTSTEKGEKKQSMDPFPGLMGLSKDDPILSFISGMEDVKPRVSEKYLKKQEKRRLKEQQQDEKNRVVMEQQNRERDEETAAINKQVEEKHLRVKAVAADGNCLYRAIAEQLALTDEKMKTNSAYRVIRRKAANYLRDHVDDFCFFLEDGVDYDAYCDRVEGSNEWGGQLELRALALALQRPIHVYSADSPVVIMGEDIQGLPLFISYHKKYLTLGNHYNTLVPILHCVVCSKEWVEWQKEPPIREPNWARKLSMTDLILNKVLDRCQTIAKMNQTEGVYVRLESFVQKNIVRLIDEAKIERSEKRRTYGNFEAQLSNLFIELCAFRCTQANREGVNKIMTTIGYAGYSGGKARFRQRMENYLKSAKMKKRVVKGTAKKRRSPLGGHGSKLEKGSDGDSEYYVPPEPFPLVQVKEEMPLPSLAKTDPSPRNAAVPSIPVPPLLEMTLEESQGSLSQLSPSYSYNYDILHNNNSIKYMSDEWQISTQDNVNNNEMLSSFGPVDDDPDVMFFSYDNFQEWKRLGIVSFTDSDESIKLVKEAEKLVDSNKKSTIKDEEQKDDSSISTSEMHELGDNLYSFM